MSFYDSIQIALTQLPVSETDIQRLKADRANFQTKSLEGMYSVYEITPEDYLEKTASFGVVSLDDRTVWHDVRMVDAHGVVVFYGYADDEWFISKLVFARAALSTCSG